MKIENLIFLFTFPAWITLAVGVIIQNLLLTLWGPIILGADLATIHYTIQLCHEKQKNDKVMEL